jgi:hypothetical protein
VWDFQFQVSPISKDELTRVIKVHTGMAPRFKLPRAPYIKIGKDGGGYPTFSTIQGKARVFNVEGLRDDIDDLLQRVYARADFRAEPTLVPFLGKDFFDHDDSGD